MRRRSIIWVFSIILLAAVLFDVPIDSEASGRLVLNASGQSATHGNGVPRGGDIHNYGCVHLPVLLHEAATVDTLARQSRPLLQDCGSQDRSLT